MSLAEARKKYDRGRRVTLVQALLMISVVSICANFIADLYPNVAYDLSSMPLQELGDVLDLDMDKDLPAPEAFVEVKGIINNRGAVVKGGRISAWVRPERWYRQLVGSPIILEIEVGDDEALRQKFQMFKEVTVRGRARRMRAHPEYDSVVQFFKRKYGYQVPENGVVITVDRVPGGSKAALVGLILLGLVILSNVVLLIIMLRRKPQIRAGD